MKLNELSPAPGSRKPPKRVGRGNGSGHGTYSGRGSKGQKSRAGFKMKPGFEGGQLPLIRRLPRQRGFTNIFKTQFEIVNLEALNIFEANTEVTPEKLVEVGILKSSARPVKILGEGELDRPLKVKAARFSGNARAKIEAAGGSVEEINGTSEV